ncbi:hypothetical protein [Tumebacillus flagellatus]|nr:hypothetical protein [Tumebacillus flagellatus]
MRKVVLLSGLIAVCGMLLLGISTTATGKLAETVPIIPSSVKPTIL